MSVAFLVQKETNRINERAWKLIDTDGDKDADEDRDKGRGGGRKGRERKRKREIWQLYRFDYIKKDFYLLKDAMDKFKRQRGIS